MATETSNTQWRAMLLCISVATLFWVFNALSKNYTTAIQCPIDFTVDKKILLSKQLLLKPYP
ncbi:MAG: hypothetical protein AAFP93_02305 [Bacteroidota bacterium]